MPTKPTHLIGVAAVALTLAACQSTPSQSQSTGTAAGKSTGTSSAPAASGVKILESGLGQSQEYVWATAILETARAQAGDYVVVNFNVKDSGGRLIKSGSQTEQVARPGSKIAVGTQIDLPAGAKAATVEATAAVDNNSPVEKTSVTTGPVITAKGEYGDGYTAAFDAKNAASGPLTGARFNLACRNSDGKINGGGSAYPDLIPGSGSTRVDVTDLLVSGPPKRCEVYYLGKL